MKSSPSSTGINFMLSPDLAAQQMALDRQQALAQAMMQEGLTPINPTRTAGNAPNAYVIPISPVEGLSHMGQAIAAAMMNKEADQKRMQLAQQQYGRIANMFGVQPQQ